MEIQLKHATVTSLPPGDSNQRPVLISVPNSGSITLTGACAQQFQQKYSQEFSSKNASQSNPNQWDDVDITLSFDLRHQSAAGHSSSR